MSTWAIIIISVIVALGFGVVIDRGGDRVVRLAQWPFPTMPATNGVIFVIILSGVITIIGVVARWL